MYWQKIARSQFFDQLAHIIGAQVKGSAGFVFVGAQIAAFADQQAQVGEQLFGLFKVGGGGADIGQVADGGVR